VGVLVLVFLGFAFGVGALSAWAGLLGWVSLPLWWWIPPPGTAVDFSSWSVDSWSHALELSAAALLATIPLAWIVAGLARGQASLMRALLAPGAGERVAALERSRAAVVRTEEEERRRLERDIHDGVQARLVALALDLGMARDKLEGGDTASAQTLVEEAHDEAKQTLATLRELVRGVHPAILADRGLDAALSALAARSPVPIDLDVDVERLPAAVETAAYFGSPRRSRTSPSTATRLAATCAPASGTETSSSRCRTTAQVALDSARAQGSAVSPTASRRSTGRFASRAPRVDRRSSSRRSHAGT
jgi:Histidine kinase